ncbi:MAG TPA: 1,2-phenylacetyl-CoA epoxidase subunit PaaC [Flavipsychrobacter sp.]
MTNQPINQSTNQLLYTLQLADNALILGHRISEWCGHGPVLEQDIALTNTALDHLGQARSFYQHAAEQFNLMPADAKRQLFASPALQQKIDKGENIDEDDLAYLRDGWDFRNVLLVEQPNKDWAYTVVRSFFADVFNFYFYKELQKSKDTVLAAIAEKSLKEVTYHLRWSSEWMIRLGDGTEDSHERMQTALDERWAYSGELFEVSAADKAMAEASIGVDVAAIKPLWEAHVDSILQEATLEKPANKWMQSGGKDGRHSEHLGYILAELQFMQRAYPNMEW